MGNIHQLVTPVFQTVPVDQNTVTMMMMMMIMTSRIFLQHLVVCKNETEGGYSSSITG